MSVEKMQRPLLATIARKTTRDAAADAADSMNAPADGDGSNLLVTSAITADRAITLGTVGVAQGTRWRVTREASATGAFNVNVGTGPLKALANGTGSWCDVVFDGTAWVLSAAGAL